MVQLAPESGRRRCNNGALAQLTQGRLPAKSRALASIPDPCDRRRGSATDPLAKAGGRHSDRPRIIQHPGFPVRPHLRNTLAGRHRQRRAAGHGMRMGSLQQSTSSRGWKEKLRSSSSSSSEAARKKLAEEKVWQRHIPCHLPCPPPSICTRIKHQPRLVPQAVKLHQVHPQGRQTPGECEDRRAKTHAARGRYSIQYSA